VQSNRLRKLTVLEDSPVPIPLDRIGDIRECRSFFFLLIDVLVHRLLQYDSNRCVLAVNLRRGPRPFSILLNSPVEFNHHATSLQTTQRVYVRNESGNSYALNVVVLLQQLQCSLHLDNSIFSMYTTKGCVYIRVVYTRYSINPFVTA